LDAIKSSEEVEIDPTNEKLRRKGNKALPTFVAQPNSKKWEKKQEEKEDEKNSTEMNERHFKNPKVFFFECDDTSKPNWRDMENDLALKYPELWVLYSRADEEKSGHLAICSLGLKEETT